MNRKLVFSLILIAFVFISGCLPFIKMESGRTIGKDKHSVGAIGTSYYISEEITKNIILPYLEIQAKYGISEKFEVSGGFNSIGFVIANGKYQLIGDQKSLFALSLGIGGDMLMFIPSKDRDIKRNFKLSIPVYTSLHVNENIYFFLIPQFSRQIIFHENENSINFLGGSTGLGFYTKTGEINFGGAFFVPLNKLQSNISQLGVSYRYIF